MTILNVFTFVTAGILIASIAETAGADELLLHLRSRGAAETKSARISESHMTAHWKPTATAILICDMWDHHWCAGATKRVGEMAPVMNEVIKAARKRGVFIIHAPSDTMDYYKGTPQRRRARSVHSGVPFAMSYTHACDAGVQVSSSSGLKNRPSSRVALSGESEPWMRLKELLTP